MDNSDFYKILNVNKNASDNEIKSSYRKLVLKYHPDKNHNIDSTEMFRKIQIAYETLSDPTKRATYDNFDLLDNSSKIKDIFLHYQELVEDICQKYGLADDERDEILGLFDPHNLKNELDRNDIDAAYKKLSDNLWSYIRQFVVKKISEKHPYIGSTLNYLFSWLF